MKAIERMKTHVDTRLEYSDKRLNEIVDWIISDVKGLENSRYDIRTKASMLISRLGGSIVTDLRTEYGRYCQLLEEAELLDSMKEDD